MFVYVYCILMTENCGAVNNYRFTRMKIVTFYNSKISMIKSIHGKIIPANDTFNNVHK